VRRLVLLAGLALAGCGGEPDALPPACSEGPDAIVEALAGAGGRDPMVALTDGTLLSTCVSHAFDDADLQLLGYSVTPAADRLAEEATPKAAVELGFLLGAVRRGAAHTNGIHLELVRKLEGTARTLGDPALEAGVRRGIAAGEARG